MNTNKRQGSCGKIRVEAGSRYKSRVRLSNMVFGLQGSFWQEGTLMANPKIMKRWTATMAFSSI
jgi:hypothetical protein